MISKQTVSRLIQKSLLISLLFSGCMNIGSAFSQVSETKHVYYQTDTSCFSLHFFRDEKFSAPLPCLVFFHGWGKITDPEQFYPQCRYLAGRGLLAVSAEYRVDDKNHFEAVRNALRAMNWIAGHAGEMQIDPNKIAIAGGSGGGWTAACLTTVCTDLGLNASLLESGIPVLQVLFNPRLTSARGLDDTYSPLDHLGKGQPPVLIMIGTEDRFLDQNQQYCRKTKEFGNACEIILYEGAGHAFFNYGHHDNRYYLQTLLEMDKFLIKQGLLKGEPTLNILP
jgi:acetyl esterase